MAVHGKYDSDDNTIELFLYFVHPFLYTLSTLNPKTVTCNQQILKPQK